VIASLVERVLTVVANTFERIVVVVLRVEKLEPWRLEKVLKEIDVTLESEVMFA
jgi:hypothetical protein